MPCYGTWPMLLDTVNPSTLPSTTLSCRVLHNDLVSFVFFDIWFPKCSDYMPDFQSSLSTHYCYYPPHSPLESLKEEEAEIQQSSKDRQPSFKTKPFFSFPFVIFSFRQIRTFRDIHFVCKQFYPSTKDILSILLV